MRTAYLMCPDGSARVFACTAARAHQGKPRVRLAESNHWKWFCVGCRRPIPRWLQRGDWVRSLIRDNPLAGRCDAYSTWSRRPSTKTKHSSAIPTRRWASARRRATELLATRI